MSSEISAGELHFIKQEKDIEEETFDSLIDKALDNVEEDIEKERTNSSLHFVVVPNGDAVDQEEDDREGSDVEDEEFFCYYCSFRCPHRDELAKHISEVGPLYRYVQEQGLFLHKRYVDCILYWGQSPGLSPGTLHHHVEYPSVREAIHIGLADPYNILLYFFFRFTLPPSTMLMIRLVPTPQGCISASPVSSSRTVLATFKGMSKSTGLT